jgi:hypothetical protein
MRYVQPLTLDQRELLENTMKTDASFRARIRAHSLLLSAQGQTIRDIAQTYQVHRVTVSSWISNWETLGGRAYMIDRAVADRHTSLLKNGNWPSNTSKKNPVPSKPWWSESLKKRKHASVSPP